MSDQIEIVATAVMNAMAASNVEGMCQLTIREIAAIAVSSIAKSLPDYGPAQPMSTAPRDGTRILVLAEVASSKYEDAINGAVIVRWDRNAAGHVGWVLSPGSRCTHLDGEPTGWWPLATEQR